MATPAITLTGTLSDLLGDDDSGCYLVISLANYGYSLPVVSGTSVIAKPGPTTMLIADGVFSVSIWGNDVITPSGTYYVIAFLDDQKNIIQCENYRLTGSGTKDISGLTPYVP